MQSDSSKKALLKVDDLGKKLITSRSAINT